MTVSMTRKNGKGRSSDKGVKAMMKPKTAMEAAMTRDLIEFLTRTVKVLTPCSAGRDCW